jgi:hypothetical protein
MHALTSITVENPPQNKQSEELNQIVDDVLNRVFGQEAVQIIYQYLEDNYFIQRDEIAEKLDSFSSALRQYLGSGALVIERLIRENLEPHGARKK